MRRILLFVFLLSLGSQVFSQKVAIVDIDSVIICMPATKKAKTRLDSLVNALQQHLNKIADSLAEKVDSIRNTLTPGQQLRVEQVKQMEDMQHYLEEWQVKAQQRAQDFQAQLRIPLEKKAKELSTTVAKEKGFTTLIDQSNPLKGILYSDLQLTDITPQVIQRVKGVKQKP